ncbi:MAG TPA: tetratricopeptide repeat protein [Vicinamibacterales bacterium]|nr:tetratricopeptide repeat protein [Vicinamibacterales bacterium]
MRKTALLTAVVVLAAAGLLVLQRLNQEQQYRQLLDQGEQALRRGRPYAAIEAFSGALALRPASMVAFYRRGEAYAAQDQNDRAVQDLQEARRLAPDAIEPLEALGHLYERQGRYADAADWFAQAADRLKDADPNLLYELALARYRAGFPAAARGPLQRAIARTDGMAEAHYLLGLVYRDAQQPEDAIASLERAVKLAPSMLSARDELADLYRERGRLADESDELTALASLDDRAGRQIALAMAMLRARRYDDALDVLQRPSVAAVASSDPRVAIALGRIYVDRAERLHDSASIPLALSSLASFVSGTPRRSDGLALFGRALYLSGDAAGAERLLHEAVATPPIDPEAFAFLADAAERASHPDVARDALLSLDVLEGDLASTDTRAHRARRIGALALAAGDAHTASQFLTMAITLGGPDAETQELLARAETQDGN